MNPTDTAIEATLIETIRAFRPEIANACSRLIQIPSVNGVNDELSAAQAIAEMARALGLHVQIVEKAPRRPNVIVSTSENGSVGLLLLGHLDTVPSGDENAWTYPPFSSAIKDGRIYGRGAIDTKGGMAAALYALAALAQTPHALHAGRAQLVCVPDEESGATGELGIKFLAEQGLLEGLGAIYAYSGQEITLGHRGLVRYRLTCRGEAIHTGAREWQDRTAGANAITGMARWLLALEALEFPLSTTRYFEAYRTLFTPGTVIRGGTSINIVPDQCEALIDIRLTPEHDLAFIDAQMRQTLDTVVSAHQRLSFGYELMNYVPAAISDEAAPLFQIVEEVIRETTSTIPPRVVAGPANEGYLLIERGIPTLCGLGPTGENAHAPNEYVEIEGLVTAATIFALTARRLSAFVSESPKHENL